MVDRGQEGFQPDGFDSLRSGSQWVDPLEAYDSTNICSESAAAQMLVEAIKPGVSKECVLEGLSRIQDLLPESYEMYSQTDFHGVVHPHAYSEYGPLEPKNYLYAFRDVILATEMGGSEVNIHLPYEVQFHQFRDLEAANAFMDFVDQVGEAMGIPVVWENSMLLDIHDGFRLIQEADYFPTDRELCLDTGHLILGSRDQGEARQRVSDFLDEHGERVKLVHFHYNDLEHDEHRWKPDEVEAFFGEALTQRVMNGRHVLFEKGSSR